MEWLDATPEARVGVLVGRGKYFTSGIDLAMLMGLGAQDRGRLRRPFPRKTAPRDPRLQDTLTSIERCRKPVLAAVHGACIGGGIDLITACDMRYCSADAWFAVREIDVGMTADVGTLQRLPRLVGDGMARELAYTGRRVDGAEAQQMRLVNRCFDTPDAAPGCHGNRPDHCRQVTAVDPRLQGNDHLRPRPQHRRRPQPCRHVERRDAAVERPVRGRRGEHAKARPGVQGLSALAASLPRMGAVTDKVGAGDTATRWRNPGRRPPYSSIEFRP
jgi:enoyl-CoA hydratase/carnithine racemase